MGRLVKRLLRDASEVLVCTEENAKILDQALTAAALWTTAVLDANTNLMLVKQTYALMEQLALMMVLAILAIVLLVSLVNIFMHQLYCSE